MMSLNVRVGGGLREFVAQAVGDDGDYDNASEYVRDLIRKDKEKSELKAFEAKRTALAQAFALPKSAYRKVRMEEVIERNLAERK